MQWTIHILETIPALNGFELVHFDNHSAQLIPEKCSISGKKLYKGSKYAKGIPIDICLLKIRRVFLMIQISSLQENENGVRIRLSFPLCYLFWPKKELLAIALDLPFRCLNLGSSNQRQLCGGYNFSKEAKGRTQLEILYWWNHLERAMVNNVMFLYIYWRFNDVKGTNLKQLRCHFAIC